MAYEICYGVCCHKGKIRQINQDNFWVDDQYLELEHEGLERSLCGKKEISDTPIFAVFDGMGGEKDGEYASYLAADTFQKIYIRSKKKKIQDFLVKSCKEINQRICSFAAERGGSITGTTGAFLAFEKRSVYICNIGDSRIYRFRGRRLKQISVDHSLWTEGSRKAPLTQFLGVPEEEFLIQPYIGNEKYKKKDCYLICSDGLTDMVSEKEIEEIMKETVEVERCGERLLNTALEHGGKDNITIVICEIQKKAKTIYRKIGSGAVGRMV